MNNLTLYNSSCFKMAELADNSVQCVVTSPPYWGLRKYKAPDMVFGDGWSGQFGLEPTIEGYVQHSIEVLREIKRVLRPDGVCFWNIGDSYAANGERSNNNGQGASTMGWPGQRQETLNKAAKMKLPSVNHGLKPKDLCLIPFRVALAAQADGWWVRSDIIWNKPNPMPESVTDRPTDAYEHIFMFTKSARYYWDAEAVKEPDHPDGRKQTVRLSTARYQDKESGLSPFQDCEHERWTGSRNIRNVWTVQEPLMRLRSDILPDAQSYVLGELMKRGLLTNILGSEGGQLE